MDYLESRGYQAGDDIRSMDWRVTARSGDPHIKIYQEERERPVVVLIDFSPSMFFATRNVFKSVIAARCAALIGWAAVQHGDRIGALLFTQDRHVDIPVAGGNRGALHLIRELVATGSASAITSTATQPSKESGKPASSQVSASTSVTALSAALLRLRRIAHPGSLVYILSDFYTLDQDCIYRLQQLRRHCDIAACQILDPLELAPPPPGRYGITDGNRRTVLDTRNVKQRDYYNDYFTSQHRKINVSLRQLDVPLLRVLTTDNVVNKLRTGFSFVGHGQADSEVAA
jgi:uncharacterized protein (DUF58 family)